MKSRTFNDALIGVRFYDGVRALRGYTVCMEQDYRRIGDGIMEMS